MNKIFAILLFLTSVLTLSAEEMVWAMNTDTGEQIVLSDVDYLIAADDSKEFSIVLNGGTSIDGVTEVTFSMVSSVSETTIQNDLQMFPNPVVSTFTLSGHKNGEIINILSLDGKLQKSIKADSEQVTIDVSDLTPDYYLLSTERSTIKFIKK